MTSKLLEQARALSEEAKAMGRARREESSCGGEDEESIRRPKLKGAKKKRKPKVKKTPFKEWFIGAADVVEEITGMGLEYLPEIPWGRLYREGYSTDEAVQEALRLSEDGDDEDEYGDVSGMSFKEWSKAMSHELQAMGEGTLGDVRRAHMISNRRLHGVFMEKESIHAAAQELLGDAEPQSRPVKKAVSEGRKRQGRFIKLKDDEPKTRLTELMSSLRVRDTGGASGIKSPEELKTFEEEATPVYDEGEDLRRAPRGRDVIDETLGLPVMPEQQEDLSILQSAMAGVKHDVGKEKAKRAKKAKLEEAEVAGGDFGRWGPATKAAGAAGRAIAKVLSSKGDTKYTFSSKGVPQSEEGGTVIWFFMQANPKTEKSYWLGFKHKGEKDDPRWDVILKTGKGLGASSVVASKKDIDSGGLSAAAMGLKGSLGGSE